MHHNMVHQIRYHYYDPSCASKVSDYNYSRSAYNEAYIYLVECSILNVFGDYGMNAASLPYYLDVGPKHRDTSNTTR